MPARRNRTTPGAPMRPTGGSSPRWLRRQGPDQLPPDPEAVGLYLAVARRARRRASSRSPPSSGGCRALLELRAARPAARPRTAISPPCSPASGAPMAARRHRRRRSCPRTSSPCSRRWTIGSARPARPGDPADRLRRRPAPLGNRRPRLRPGRPTTAPAGSKSSRRRPLLTLRGKTGWREVEIGRGSVRRDLPGRRARDLAALGADRPRAAVPRASRARTAASAPSGSPTSMSPGWSRHAALAAGLRGDLTEGERRARLRGPFAARRPRLLRRGRRALCAEAARPRLAPK